ncbi:hypothetical protein MN116_001597 [Schistosoma mekongi]|uniref:SUEL-type lectin domain-containing protein n=1 Tax=Schistosoma mekongi TaxID=38744 RepID=A0AAE1ZJE3_SCHME|nr:hypothetical protein MN116_001597 [Schistosoma mekongi]
MNKYLWIVIFISTMITKGYVQVLQNDILNSLGLRQFEISLCTNVEVNVYSNPSLTDQQMTIYCPHRTTLHIIDAYYKQSFDKNSQCLKSPASNNGNQKYHDIPTVDISLRNECYARSVGSIVKRICNGANKCDLTSHIKQDNFTKCPYPSILQVNYTCLPVYSKQEVICADSYVELSCKAFSMDMGLIILEAVLNQNLSMHLTSSSKTGLLTCPGSSINRNQCPSVDSISFVSNQCNGYLTCTISPNLVIESVYRLDSRKFILFKQMSCTKSYLYLRYTCVHNLLLETNLRQEDSKKLSKHRDKQVFKTKKKLNKSSGIGLANQKNNDKNVMYFNDDLNIYSGQENEINLQLISERPKSKSSTVTLNDELLSVLSELSVSPKTKSTHIYLSALLPSVLCILVSCVFVIAILCHRKHLFKSKYKSNNISRILHNPTYCDQHSSCNVTVGDNNSHEIGYQSDIQTNHSYSSKLVKNPLPEWVNGKNLTTHFQPLQQTNNSNVNTVQYCPSCNNDQKEISQLYHYQNILYGDNEIISNDKIPNQSVKASPNSSSHLASTEDSFTPNSIGIINKVDDIYPSSATCLSGAFVNNSVKHQNQCYSPQFNHINSLVFGNYAAYSNNSCNNNNNSQQTNTCINDQISNEQENISKVNYYYDGGKIIPNVHVELRDANILEHEKSTLDSHQKFMNTNPKSTSVNLKEQMNCKVTTRLAPPLFSSGDDLLPNYMMNTKSPVHLKYGLIPVVRYPYDSEDHSDNSDSESQKYLKTKEALHYSRHYRNKPDVCLTVNKNEINKEFLVSTSSTIKTSHPKFSQISRTASDHRVQNSVSPSLIRSVTSQLTSNSANSFVKIPKPFTKTICTMQPTNVLNDTHNSEHHIQSSPINVKNISLIYDSNKLSPLINSEDISNSMCRSVQP